jgi:pimeloyl-ACP methyl ester carboxylesterase
MIRGNAEPGMAAALVAMATRTDTSGSLAEVGVPSLVIVGEEDAITSPTSCAALARAIPGGRLSVLRHAGHVSNLEAPDAFNEALLEFLDGLPPC